MTMATAQWQWHDDNGNGNGNGNVKVVLLQYVLKYKSTKVQTLAIFS